ncbi:hypothetical protein [Actinokineospora enzanensis]|uniref:hypothetical protein n=1 Tax=Actinokineospora enzanensis TaxID=155975 RepID=UPI000364F640|nr:hypothetical protein [Actinokineospora enzanensis]
MEEKLRTEKTFGFPELAKALTLGIDLHVEGTVGGRAVQVRVSHADQQYLAFQLGLGDPLVRLMGLPMDAVDQIRNKLAP